MKQENIDNDFVLSIYRVQKTDVNKINGGAKVIIEVPGLTQISALYTAGNIIGPKIETQGNKHANCKTKIILLNFIYKNIPLFSLASLENNGIEEAL